MPDEGLFTGTDTSYAQPDLLFRNEGEGRFEPEPLYDGPERVSRAGALADLDGDGDLDLVAIELDGPVHVLLNTTRTPGQEASAEPHWLHVRLRGRGSNTAGLGALVTAESDGGRRAVEIRTSAGYQAAAPPEAHFGLAASTRVRTLTVRWPSGREQVLEDVAVDRVLVVDEPADGESPR